MTALSSGFSRSEGKATSPTVEQFQNLLDHHTKSKKINEAQNRRAHASATLPASIVQRKEDHNSETLLRISRVRLYAEANPQ